MSSAVVGSLRVVLGLDSAAFTNGLSDTRRALASAGKEMQTIGRNMSMWVTGPVVAVGGALAATTHKIAGQAEEMRRLAQVSNAGYEEFQRLAHAASTVGIESDKLADIYKDMNDRVGDFMQTGGGPMADFFENIAPKVGITADEFARLSGPEALQAYYNALQEAGVSQADMTFYLEAMASDVTALIPLLQNGGQAFKELGEEAAVISEQDAGSLQEYQDAMRRMGEAIEAVAIAFATSGILTHLVGFIETASGLLRGLENVNPEIVQFGVVFGGLAAVVGPALIVIGGIATVMAGLSAPILGAVAAITAITAAVVVFWPEIQNLASVITEFLANAWMRFETAWDGMTAKVGEVKASIAAFAAEIPAFFEGLPEMMWQIGVDIIGGLGRGIMQKWDEIKGGIMNIPSGIADSWNSFWQIRSPSRVTHQMGEYVMQGLGDGMQSMESSVSGIATNIANTVSNAFMGIIQGTQTVGEAIQSVISQLGQMFLNQGFQALIGGMFGGGGGGGLFAGIGKLFGFAKGGTIMPGGAGGIDSQLVAFRKSPNERVDITKPGQTLTAGGGRMGLDVSVSVDEQGNLVPMIRKISGEGDVRVVKSIERGMPGMLAEAQMRQG